MGSHPAAWNRAEGKDIATFKQLSKNPTYSRHPIYPMIHSKPQRYPDLFRRCSELRVVLYFPCQPAKLEFSFLTVTKSVILHPCVQKNVSSLSPFLLSHAHDTFRRVFGKEQIRFMCSVSHLYPEA